jgi:hypothetical protein
MTYREWRDDLTRREAQYITSRAPEHPMNAELRFALDSEDCRVLRKMDDAFREVRK